MKYLISTFSLVLFLIYPAFSNELQLFKSAQVMSPITGFYAGFNSGYNFASNSSVISSNWSSARTTPETIPDLISFAPLSMNGSEQISQQGYIGGGQLGFNYEFKNLVFGIETDFQGATAAGNVNIEGLSAGGQTFTGPNNLLYSSSEVALGITQVSSGLSYLGTFRGRVGYLLLPSLMIFGTGGLSYGGVWAQINQSSLSITSVNIASPAELRGTAGPYASGFIGRSYSNKLMPGWNAGGGAEWFFDKNWSLKFEGIYWDLGRVSIATTATQLEPRPIIAFGNTSIKYSGIISRAGINYRFNWE